MNRPVSHLLSAVWALGALVAAPAWAQPFEMVGERALGMGGAFVAVANDGSATWWNPAGLATGPFLDLAIARSAGSQEDELPAGHSGSWSFWLATPPLGLSYHRFRVAEIRADSATGQAEGSREDGAAALSARSFSVYQVGATVLHTITTGVNAGATVKYVRGTALVRALDEEAASVPIPRLVDVAQDLEGGDGQGTVDVDLGILAVTGALRFGAAVRNLREPAFGARTLPRQVRAGVAFDGEAAGMAPLTVSMDADLRRYDVGIDERRMVAVGGEHWVRPRRLAVRAGARFNTVGARDHVVTVGASVALRAALFVEGHAAVGAGSEDCGWGIAARVSF